MAVILAGGTLKAACAAGGDAAKTTIARYAKKLGDARPPRRHIGLPPEKARLAQAKRVARWAGCTIEEVLQHWAKDEAWCRRCAAWLHRNDHNSSDCIRAFWRSQGMCVCCGKPPRPGLRTCEKEAARGAAYQRAKTQRKRAAEQEEALRS